MITAEKLQQLTTYKCDMLSRATGENFTGAKFLGITNGYQFCYLCTFPVEGGTDSTKVFITYNPTEGSVIATVG